MKIWMECPSCEGLFSAPLGHAEGGCVFCGVILKINTGIKVLRQEDENGVAVIDATVTWEATNETSDEPYQTNVSVTYDNECQLDNADVQKLYAGACVGD